MDTLPPLFLTRRKRFPLVDRNSSDTFALVKVNTVRPPLTFKDYVTFTLVEYPSQVLQDGSIYDDHSHPPSRLFSIDVYRPSRRLFATQFFTMNYLYEFYEFRSDNGRLKLPVLHIANSSVVLPSQFKAIGEQPAADKYKVVLSFHHLVQPNSHSLRMPPLLPDARPTPLAPPSSVASAIPQHLVNMVLEAAIDKATSCPISFEPFTKASARLTPCGHLVSHLAAERWLSNAHSCPVCRQELEASALMKWVA